MSKGKLLLLDGNSLAYRAFYALPNLKTSRGQYTNAIYGFLNILFRLIENEKPTHIISAFDKGRPTFRVEAFQDYKAHRKETPGELKEQFPLLKELLSMLNIQVVELAGFEADDIIGTYARMASEQDIETLIVTGDRDALQLVAPGVSVMLTKKGISEVDIYNEANFMEKCEITPAQIIDLKGLMGDASDNIPGVPGIGEKTALKLVKEFGSVDAVIDNLDKITTKKLKENIGNFKEQAILSRKLATIDIRVPLEGAIKPFEPLMVNRSEIAQKFDEYEFRSILKKLDGIYPAQGSLFEMDEKMPEIQEVSVEVKIIKTVKDFDELSELISTQNNFAYYLVLDSSKSLNAKALGVALAVNGELFYIGLEDETGTVTLEQVFGLFSLKQKDGKIIEKIGHDLKCDIIFFFKAGLNPEGFIWDTMVASYLASPLLNDHTLESLINVYLQAHLSMLPATIMQVKSEELAEIAAKRAMFIEKLMPVLFDKLSRLEMLQLFSDVEMPLVEVLAQMEFNGITVDPQILKGLSAEFGQKISELEEEIFGLADTKFNINSPKQLGEVLFDKLKLPVFKKTKTGYSTGAEVLEELSRLHPIAEKILLYRQIAKLKSTYADALVNLINPETGRVHTTFNQVITSTGRLSSTEPNLQNIPIRMEIGREIRRAFVPAKEHYLLTADYSQIELRIMAHLSSDPNLIDAFKKGQDIHARTASEVFHTPLEEVTKEMRRRAKAVNFGIVYGISDFGLAKDLGIMNKEAHKYISEYFERYPRVKEYLDSAISQARENGYVTTLFNRRRYLPDIDSKNRTIRSFAERTAMNTPLQGTAADIMKIAMDRISDRLKECGSMAKLLLQVHDDVVIEVPEDELMRVAKIVKESMETAAVLDVPLEAELKYGQDWKNLNELQF